MGFPVFLWHPSEHCLYCGSAGSDEARIDEEFKVEFEYVSVLSVSQRYCFVITCTV